MGFRWNSHRLIALLEQSDVYCWGRGVWMLAAACAAAKQDGDFAGDSDRRWTATGADAQIRRHDGLSIVQSGLHAGERFVVADCAVSRMDVRDEMDFALGGSRLRDRISAKTAPGLHEPRRNRLCLSTQCRCL